MRRSLDLALLGLLVVLAAVGALRWLDVAVRPVVALQESGPLVIAGLVSLVLAAALLRRWWLLVPSAVVLAVALGLAVPTYFARGEHGGAGSAQKDLTVMVADLREGRADAQQLMAAVRARAVDVLVLVEVTPESLETLRERGLDREFSTSAGRAAAGSSTGTMVYSRFPLEQTVERGTAAAEPVVSLQLDGAAVTLRAVHAPQPDAGSTDAWRQSLRTLAAWERGSAGPTVLAGGFAADWGHPGFRALAEDFDDAHRVMGLGWVRTYPMDGHRLPPYLQPDHLLSRDLTVVDAGQVAIHGADHALVCASAGLPGAN